jgi:hypothetical protein
MLKSLVSKRQQRSWSLFALEHGLPGTRAVAAGMGDPSLQVVQALRLVGAGTIAGVLEPAFQLWEGSAVALHAHGYILGVVLLDHMAELFIFLLINYHVLI